MEPNSDQRVVKKTLRRVIERGAVDVPWFTRRWEKGADGNFVYVARLAFGRVVEPNSFHMTRLFRRRVETVFGRVCVRTPLKSRVMPWLMSERVVECASWDVAFVVWRWRKIPDVSVFDVANVAKGRIIERGSGYVPWLSGWGVRR